MDNDGVRVLPDEDDARVIVCRGELDMDTLAPLTAAVQRAVAHPDSRRIIIDVADVSFADSSMLNLLLAAHRSARLVLAGPLQKQFVRLLETTGANSILTIADSLPTARTLPLG
ncbi:hypothetical protein AMK16_25685 [Streptomyces sp. CB00455]|uniref:STAS domain-containing protein n=1 Tax=Streptomyces sp. CB00455 TaxID=1703927 RepID=UPI00093DAB04|nr:STAS domain-containing protein [Streptomyces sp. CB00455]OKK16112.1 hypothetical protein AMK16_25685 [Streptomyces sp. CB00455]